MLSSSIQVYLSPIIHLRQKIASVFGKNSVSFAQAVRKFTRHCIVKITKYFLPVAKYCNFAIEKMWEILYYHRNNITVEAQYVYRYIKQRNFR